MPNIINLIKNKLMNTEETVVTEVIEAPVVEVVETEVKTSNITVNDQTGNLVQAFTNADEAYAFAGENGYQVNVA